MLKNTEELEPRSIETARDSLRDLATRLEGCGYGMAGQVDSIQVARVLSLSHEISELAERLRAADL